jgi:hypothetical protein
MVPERARSRKGVPRRAWRDSAPVERVDRRLYASRADARAEFPDMPPPPPLDRDAIVARAFALYVRRGRQPGHELADWYEAERQLKAEADALAKAKSAPKSPTIVPPAAQSAAPHVPAVLAAPAKPTAAAPVPKAAPVPAPKPAAAPAPAPQAKSSGQGGKKKKR